VVLLWTYLTSTEHDQTAKMRKRSHSRALKQQAVLKALSFDRA
jgi:hypothetical protein